MRLQYNALLSEAVRDSDRLTVRPDAVHLLGGRPVVVYNAKYKAASDAGASLTADHYQMLAHCTALRVPTAWLVYAGAGEMKLRRILNTDIDIVEYPLDLSLPPSESWPRWRTWPGNHGAKWSGRRPVRVRVGPKQARGT